MPPTYVEDGMTLDDVLEEAIGNVAASGLLPEPA
jgi:hypothetical protein